MRECRYKKRLQIYLDGWLDKKESGIFEEHLKHCAECQAELSTLEEVNSAALDIIDEAPERDYWESFSNRVRNRIVARNTPVLKEEKQRREPRFAAFRLAAVFMTTIAIAFMALMLLRIEMRTLVERNAVNSIQTQKSSVANSPLTSQQPTNREKLSAPRVINPEPIIEVRPAVAKSDDQARVTSLTRLVTRDLKTEFVDQPLSEEASSKLDDNFVTLNELLASRKGNEKGYKLRQSILDERLIAGLSQNGLRELTQVYHGPLYSLHAQGLTDKWVDLEDDNLAAWGYLRMPSDTSKANEIRRYLIELELMQNR